MTLDENNLKISREEAKNNYEFNIEQFNGYIAVIKAIEKAIYLKYKQSVSTTTELKKLKEELRAKSKMLIGNMKPVAKPYIKADLATLRNCRKALHMYKNYKSDRTAEGVMKKMGSAFADGWKNDWVTNQLNDNFAGRLVSNIMYKPVKSITKAAATGTVAIAEATIVAASRGVANLVREFSRGTKNVFNIQKEKSKLLKDPIQKINVTFDPKSPNVNDDFRVALRNLDKILPNGVKGKKYSISKKTVDAPNDLFK